MANPGNSSRRPPPALGDPSERLDSADPLELMVELPAGGMLEVRDEQEKVMWDTAKRRYVDDYKLSKANDLVLLGAILAQILAMYRAQRDLNDPKKAAAAQALITKTSTEIRAGEKALGVDKASREKGGQQSIPDYIDLLKKAAHSKGVRISERVKEYERVMMEARWKIRLLRNGDTEDRAYHNLSERSIVDWLEVELSAIEQKDQKWAQEKGAIFVGRL